MGLDMYLYKKHFITQGQWYKEEERYKLSVKKGGKVDKNIDTKKVKWVIEEAAYWRKANQIHNWFVENVQKGEDDCGDYYVGREQLEELLALCKEVKADNTKAEELLPTTEGFFFGSNDYTGWYFETIDWTITQLEKALENTDDYDFSYTSSW